MRVYEWIRPAGGGGGPTSTRRGRGARRLAIQRLEDRRLLAVLDVGPGAHYATIQAAVDVARPGDVVLVADGQYPESVNLGRMGVARGGTMGDLTIRGTTADSTAVSPPGTTAFFSSVTFTGDLSIEQLTVSGATSGPGVSGVQLAGLLGDLTVTDVLFEQLSDGGVDVGSITGDVWLQSNRFDRVGDAAADAAMRVAELAGAGVISGNDFEDGKGLAIDLASLTNRESTWLLDDNYVFGDPILFSTTVTGIRLRLAGDSRTDLILDRNAFDGLSGAAIDIEAMDRAELQTRWSENSASSVQGLAAARVVFRDQSAGALLAEDNSWTDVYGSGVSVRIDDAARVRAIVQYDAFTSIGDGRDDAPPDEALVFVTGPTATGEVDLFLFNNSMSTVAGNGLRISAGGSAPVRAVVTENAFDATNGTPSMPGAALVIEHATDASQATIDLRLAGNSAYFINGEAYALRQRGTAVMRLEGSAATAAAQIAQQNAGVPVTVAGAVSMVPAGTLDPRVPLLLGDTVWQDDGNAVQNLNEPGVAAIVIRLSGVETAGGAAVHRITQSDASGRYTFAGLAPGQYTLTVDVPFAARLATANQGVDEATDSDFDPVFATASITLVAAADDMTVDVGLWRTWQNPRNPLDVDDDGDVIPLDVLILINDINARNSRPLPIPPQPPSEPPPYLDVSGNAEVSPQDVLIIINFINASSVGGAGEGESAGPGFLEPGSSASMWTSHISPTREPGEAKARMAVRRSPDGSQGMTVRPSGRRGPAPHPFGEIAKPTASKRQPGDGRFAGTAEAEAVDDWFAQLGATDGEPPAEETRSASRGR